MKRKKEKINDEEEKEHEARIPEKIVGSPDRPCPHAYQAPAAKRGPGPLPTPGRPRPGRRVPFLPSGPQPSSTPPRSRPQIAKCVGASLLCYVYVCCSALCSRVRLGRGVGGLGFSLRPDHHRDVSHPQGRLHTTWLPGFKQQGRGEGCGRCRSIITRALEEGRGRVVGGSPPLVPTG